jgi:hypothetical protein
MKWPAPVAFDGGGKACVVHANGFLFSGEQQRDLHDRCSELLNAPGSAA